MHRAVIFTALAGSAILVTGLVATGNATVPSHRVAADQSRNPRPFSIVEQDQAQARTHPDVQPGDVVATTFTLWRGTNTVGRAQNACISMPDAAAATSGVAQCTQTFFFAHGQIVVARARFAQPHRDAAAIVGGTGAYRGVRGNATFEQTSNPIRYRVNFRPQR